MNHVTDTHGLVWHMTEDSRLGSRASEIFEKADEGEDNVIIPTIVLAETVHICEKKREPLKVKEVLDKIRNSTNYIVYNLNFEIIETLSRMEDIPGLHDRIIAATARITKSKVITRDSKIEEAGIETIWQ